MSRKTTRTSYSTYSYRSSLSGHVEEGESEGVIGDSSGRVGRVSSSAFESSFSTSSSDPGRIETILMSKDEKTLEIKLNKKRETLSLIPFEGNSWKKLKKGKGPSSKNISGSRSRTQDLGQIFRDKETLAELDEKKSSEKIAPNLERVESIKKKLEGCKKSGLPLTLGLRPLQGTYGHLVNSPNGDVLFKPGEKSDENVDNFSQKTSISGQFIEEQKRFVPGRLVAPDKFLPGMVTDTSKGPKFIAGQVLSTKKGQKFFPGQYYANQFVPGQIIRQADGEPRFIPGQVIDTFGAGPTFIPGQIMSVNGHDSFVPGQVIEVNGQARFVPGRVVEEEGSIKFISGELVDTEDGLKWVQFSLQTLDIDQNLTNGISRQNSVENSDSILTTIDPEIQNIDSLHINNFPNCYSPCTPSINQIFDPSSLFNSSFSHAFETLVLAGVEVGDKIIVPSVEIELSENLRRPQLQRSVSINTFSLFHKVLSSMSQVLEKNSLDPENELNVKELLTLVKNSESCHSEDIKSMLLHAIGEIIEEGDRELSPNELKKIILDKISSTKLICHEAPIAEEENEVEEKNQSSQILKSFREIELRRCQEVRMGKILAKEIDERDYESQLLSIGQKLSLMLSDEAGNYFESLNKFLANKEILTSVLEVNENDQETRIEDKVKSSIANLANFSQLESLLPQNLNDFIESCVLSAKLLNKTALIPELLHLKDINFNPNISPQVKNFVQVVLLSQNLKLNEEKGENLKTCRDLVEFSMGKIEKFSEVEKLVDELMWDACVIVKNDLKTIVPKEAASKILSGEARYSVLDESGIRFFEPRRGSRSKLMLKSFSEEIQSVNFTDMEMAQNVQSQHGVHITEITTPDPDDFVGFEGGFKLTNTTETRTEYDLDLPAESLLDSSLAKSKLAVKQTGKRRGTSPKSPSKDSSIATIREDRAASIRELVETEDEFLKDMEFLLSKFYKAAESSSDKKISESREIIFGTCPQIANFHQNLLIEALKNNSGDAASIARAFTRLEREFDIHAQYIEEECRAEVYLKSNPTIEDFYSSISPSSSKSLIECLRLPNQRLNDYSVILQELLDYNRELGESTGDLERALELMRGIPQKNGDEKFLKAIEGYKGSIQGLGRLLSHEWFALTDTTGSKRERYLFLFKGRILVTKVKRISEDRSVFILKDVLRLPDLELVSDDEKSIYLTEPSTGGKYKLEHIESSTKNKWLNEIKAYAASSDKMDRTRRQSSVTVDSTVQNSSDEEKSEVNLKTKEKKKSIVKQRSEIGATTEEAKNVLVVRRESLKSEPEKGPKLVKGIKSVACEPGDSAKLVVKFESESPCSVTWLKDNKALDDRLADRIKMTSLGTEFSMELLNCIGDDSGLYTARASNEYGSRTSSGILNVHEMTPEERAARMAENSPSFRVKFRDVEIIQDSVACFMIATCGDPLPKIRIYKNGTDLIYDERVKLENGDEAGHYDLLINHVQASDAGTYKVVASNIYGSESFVAQVGVVEEKDVFHGLENGGEPLEFKWFRDGKNFTPEERFKVMFKDDEDTLALIFQHVKPEDAGLYTCVASTSSGKISCSAELTVKGAVHQLLKEPAPPVIKTKLIPTELNANGSGMLEIKTEGFPAPQLAWFKDDKEITGGEKYRFLHEDSESTALIIKNVDLSDAGSYKVIATNELGTDESSATIIVKSPPKFTKEIKDTAILRGSELVMELMVDGSPTPQLKFYKDGQEITNSSRISISKSENCHKIIIKEVDKSDGGSYSAVATNSVGQMSSFWTLIVNNPPQIVSTFEKRIEKEVGESLILELVTEGTVKNITWKIDDVPIDNKTQKSSSDGTKHKLELKNLTRSSSAKISASVSNDFGSLDANTDLIIKRKPQITQKLKPIITNLGDSAEFTIKVDSYPEPKIKWFLGDVVIDSKKYEKDVDGGSFKLKLPNVEASGTVKVKVENDYGYDEDSAELTVKRKPEFKKGLKDITVIEEETLDMVIDIVGTPSPNLRMFHNGNEVEANARVKITKESTETYHMTFNVVLPSDNGDWTIKATNECGEVESRCKITVEGKPIFEQKLAKTIEVIESEDLELSVTIRGSPTPIIKWVLNNTELQTSKNILITTNNAQTSNEVFSSRLKITNITMEEQGDLCVSATNKHGKSETTGLLKILPLADLKAPKIVTQLESATFVKGEDGELVSKVKGTPPPEVKWFKNGLCLGSGVVSGEDVKLPLKGICEENGGEYELVATNEHGEARTKAQVSILAKPEILGFENLKLSPGEPVILSAHVSGSPQVSSVQWFKDGTPLEDNGENVMSFENGVATLQLGPACKGTPGTYSIRAKSDIGQTEAKAKVAVQLDPPVFIKGLTDQEFKDGEELVMRCKVSGTPKPEVCFTKDGAPVVGFIEQDGVFTLNVEKASVAHVGKYKAEASNSGGLATSEGKVSMTQLTPKLLKSLPRRESFSEGEPIMLKIKVDGSPKPSVAWLKDGVPLEPNNRLQIEELPDGTCKLVISDGKPGDRGTYSVILENPNGKTESSAGIEVHGKHTKPEFIQPLSGQTTVPQGKPLKLTAKVSGYPLPEVKWLKDGRVLRPSTGILSTISPGGDISLEIPVTSEGDRGIYKLVVSNDKGEIGQEVQVSVGPPLHKPTFSQGLADTSVVQGFPLELEASITSNPPPKLSVLKDGLPSEIQVKVLTRDGAMKAVIALPSVSEASSGIYTLQAENSEGATKSTCTVGVIPKESGEQNKEPSFIKGLTAIKVDEGEEFELVGLVSGVPLPEVEWSVDGQSLGGGLFDGKSVRLRIKEAQMSHNGLYKCELSNGVGKTSSEAAVIVRKVYQKPEFRDRFSSMQQMPTRDCKFGARVTGVPSPSISWLKDGVPIKASEKYAIRKDGDIVSLTVRNCCDGDKGRFTCLIENCEGSDKCEADLDIVKEIAKTPMNECPAFLKKINGTEIYDGMDARFTACVTGFPEPEFEWFKDGSKLSPSSRLKFEKEGAGLLRLLISKTSAQDAGNYKLRIFNSVGEASCEAGLRVEILEVGKKKPLDESGDFDKYKKSGLPLPLGDKPIISSMSERHLTLSWRPSMSSAARYPVTYVVEMCEVEGPKSDWFTVRRGLRNCVCDIRNLDPWLDYKFRIRVENEYGVSEPSPYAITLRSKFDRSFKPWSPVPTHPIPKNYDLEIPPHDGYSHPPKFLNQPHDTQYGVRDMSSKILWYVYGYPKPSIEFFFNGIDITKDIGGGKWATTYLNNGEVALFVNRMTESVVGKYLAVAKNGSGEDRQEVNLKIAESPRFITRPNETYILIRKDGKTSCKVSGIPLPEIKFYKDWAPLGESSRIKLRVDESLDGDYLTINFELRDSISKDAGLYSITASNLAGTSHTSFNVRIEENEDEYLWGSYGSCRPIKTRPKPFDDYYDPGDELGRGTQGIISHVVERGSGRSWACKHMRGSGVYRDWMTNEVNIMEGLSHPHITRLHEWFSEPSGMRILMEMSSGGDLISSLISRTDVSEYEISGYIRQLLLGLDYLHGVGIAHLGLTPFDLLITRPNGRELKVTDFGLGRRIGSKLTPLDYGMPEFVAPEVVLGRGVGFPADIWSVGVITHLLLSGYSLFGGRNDMETLDRIKSGSWTLSDRLSVEARDFLTKLLVFEESGRLDIKGCLNHPWISKRREKTTINVTTLTTTYYESLRSWYSNASCRDIYRRRPLSGAYTHPSKMVYPPGEWTPERGRTPSREPKEFLPTDSHYPRPNLDTEIGKVSSESHYQTGPDTYLLQLRDADFPARLRQYMKVAAHRSPAMAIQLKGAAYDTDRSVIRERRRFTDIMDEEVDDERRDKINSYGHGDPRRIRHEVGQHMDITAEAEAIVLSKREGTVPLFRLRPSSVVGGVIGQELIIDIVVDGDPAPSVQWFKNDLVVGESNRLKTIENGSQFRLSFSKLLAFDIGLYKVVVRNSNGHITARFRIQEADKVTNAKLPTLDYTIEKTGLSPLLDNSQEFKIGKEIYSGKFSRIFESETTEGGIVRHSRGYSEEIKIIGTLKHVNLANVVSYYAKNGIVYSMQEGIGSSLLHVLSNSKYSEQTLCLIVGQLLDGLSYLHWIGYGLLNLEPGNILLSSVDEPIAKIADFSSLQPVSRIGTQVKVFTPIEFTSPEVLSSDPAFPTTDIWSIGVLLYVLLSGHSPFSGETDEDTRANVNYVRFRFEYLFKDLTQEVTRFIMLLFKKSPMKRPSIEECFEHRWLLPSEFMLKKREKSSFRSGLLSDYAKEYYEKRKTWWNSN